MIFKYLFLTATIGEVAASFVAAFQETFLVGSLHVNVEPLADMGISLICQYAIAFILIKLGRDKFQSLIIGDIVSNILLAILVHF